MNDSKKLTAIVLMNVSKVFCKRCFNKLIFSLESFRNEADEITNFYIDLLSSITLKIVRKSDLD